ncbi:DUF4238 domain-containing protein [Turicibacter bilis]|uniref:DUF4238 domain-containing protein n=1 Tax=Turicibacter bilis TaxID=2735723 RepID=UPI001BAF0B22|nr:DUF4238 domain-containing protein [Turicibacter bilis]
MTTTKKQHYVPRCYLKNFLSANDRINVFDSFKLQIREQKIMDIAMENYFYDIKFSDLLQRIEKEGEEKDKKKIMEILDVHEWESVPDKLDEKYIEKDFFSPLEDIYSKLLQKFIENSYEGNNWVMENCLACSEFEKDLMAFFIAIQFIRTKSFRENLGDMIAKLYQTIAYKRQMKNEDALPKEAFEFKANPDFVKLQHSSMILDKEATLETAEILRNHIWVIYVNKSESPFYTSDNPIAIIPHKRDKYRVHAGLASEGVEIVFPISSKLLLAMYEKTTYNEIFSDKQFHVLTSESDINYFNSYQVLQRYRCIFSEKKNFEFANKIYEENPELQKYQSRIEVG